MKYCPFCGADILKEEAAFCMECGKPLSEQEQTSKEEKATAPRNSKKSKSEKKMKEKKTKPVKKTKERKKKPQPEAPEEPVDDGYDGYYNDVLPPDLDQEKEGLDKELIKKIVALVVGVVFIIGICIVMMYVL